LWLHTSRSTSRKTQTAHMALRLWLARQKLGRVRILLIGVLLATNAFLYTDITDHSACQVSGEKRTEKNRKGRAKGQLEPSMASQHALGALDEMGRHFLAVFCICSSFQCFRGADLCRNLLLIDTIQTKHSKPIGESQRVIGWHSNAKTCNIHHDDEQLLASRVTCVPVPPQSSAAFAAVPRKGCDARYSLTFSLALLLPRISPAGDDKSHTSICKDHSSATTSGGTLKRATTHL